MSTNITDLLKRQNQLAEEAEKGRKGDRLRSGVELVQRQSQINTAKKQLEVGKKQLEVGKKQLEVQEGIHSEAIKTNKELSELNNTSRQIEQHNERMVGIQAELLNVSKLHLDVARAQLLQLELQAECSLEMVNYARLERALRNSIYAISSVVDGVSCYESPISRYFVLKKNKYDVESEEIVARRLDSIDDKVYVDSVTLKLNQSLERAASELSDDNQKAISEFSKDVSEMQSLERQIDALSKDKSQNEQSINVIQLLIENNERELAVKVADQKKALLKAIFLFFLVFPVIHYLKIKKNVLDVKKTVGSLCNQLRESKETLSRVNAEIDKKSKQHNVVSQKRDAFLNEFPQDVRDAILQVIV